MVQGITKEKEKELHLSMIWSMEEHTWTLLGELPSIELHYYFKDVDCFLEKRKKKGSLKILMPTTLSPKVLDRDSTLSSILHSNSTR